MSNVFNPLSNIVVNTKYQSPTPSQVSGVLKLGFVVKDALQTSGYSYVQLNGFLDFQNLIVTNNYLSTTNEQLLADLFKFNPKSVFVVRHATNVAPENCLTELYNAQTEIFVCPTVGTTADTPNATSLATYVTNMFGTQRTHLLINGNAPILNQDGTPLSTPYDPSEPTQLQVVNESFSSQAIIKSNIAGYAFNGGNLTGGYYIMDQCCVHMLGVIGQTGYNADMSAFQYGTGIISSLVIQSDLSTNTEAMSVGKGYVSLYPYNNIYKYTVGQTSVNPQNEYSSAQISLMANFTFDQIWTGIVNYYMNYTVGLLDNATVVSSFITGLNNTVITPVYNNGQLVKSLSDNLIGPDTETMKQYQITYKDGNPDIINTMTTGTLMSLDYDGNVFIASDVNTAKGIFKLQYNTSIY
jgi:hypothetical protein